MSLPQITIGDGLLGDALLASVDVVQELNRHWWCTIVCRNTEDARVPVEDLLGKPAQVKTSNDQGVEQVHFSGSVHHVQLDYEASGSYTATLTAVSDTFGMDVTAHKQYYANGTLSSMAATIGGRHGLSISIKAADDKALNYVQYGESDWSFLHRVVDDHGAWLRPGASGVQVFDSFQPGATVKWREDGDLVGFTLEGRRVNPSFSGSHYDHHSMQSQTFQQLNKAPQFYPAAQQLTSSVQAASQQLPPGFEPQRARAMTLSNYSDQLQAESERSLGSAVTGRGSSRNQSLMAGNTVTLDGVLDAKGTYGLTRVAHHWTPQGYINEFACTPWMQYRNPEPPVARTWSGIVPARVTAHNDPKKMGRIQVQFFWQEDGSTHWARATSPHAGPDRGFMFMPEIGDEVAVAFEDGDPERPVILGSLWNGVQQAPRYDLRGEDVGTNDVKRLVTKAGNRVQFSDKPQKETVVLATPNQTALHLTESHDSTGRPLVHIHSDGDIVLSAPNGRVHVNSLLFSREVGSGNAAAKAEADVGGAAVKADTTFAAKPKAVAPQEHGKTVDREGKPRARYSFHYSPGAIAAAQATEKKYGIPASVTLAQYGLESSGGQHMPPGSNNPFGIKAYGDQPYVTAMTTEVRNGQFVRVPQNFRRYDSLEDAFDAHGSLLAKSAHYAAARKALPDPDGFATGISGIYNADPPQRVINGVKQYTYAEKLGFIMDDGNLRSLDGAH